MPKTRAQAQADYIERQKLKRVVADLPEDMAAALMEGLAADGQTLAGFLRVIAKGYILRNTSHVTGGRSNEIDTRIS